MSNSKTKTDTIKQTDLIKSIRRELPPKGQTFQVKKDRPFRKRKHKGKIDTDE